MPTSFHKHISYVIDKIIEIKPKSVLDVGVGFGKWGSLCREYLDIYGKGDIWKTEDWETKIYGVEIFKPYLEEFKHLNFIYDKIWNCNVNDIDNFNFDCILIMDVLEHIEKQKAINLLNNSFNKSKYVIISVPLGDFRYKYKGENKNESHLSMWNEEELKKFPNYKDHKIYSLTTTGGKKITIGVFIYGEKYEDILS